MATQAPAGSKKRATWRLLWRLAGESRPYLHWYVPIAVSLMLSSLGGLAVTDALRRLVDAATQRSLPALWVGLGLGLGGFAGATLFSVAARYMRAYVDQTSAMAKQVALVDKIHRVHYDYCTSQHSGELITRLTTNASEAHSGLNAALADAVQNGGETLITLVYLIWLNRPLAVGTLIPATFGPVLLNLASGRIQRLWAGRWQREGELSALVQDAVQGGEITRAHNLQSWLLSRIDSAYAPLMLAIRRTEAWNQATQASAVTMFLCGLSFVLGYGGSLVVRGLVTPGTIAAFLVSFERITWPVSNLLSIWPNLQKSLAAAERTYELFEAPGAPGEDAATTPGVHHATALSPAAICFHDVTFGYPGRETPILQGLSLSIAANRFTAIVGETGSGKTTILRLLLRLYDPDAGRICLHGVDGHQTDLATVSLAEWRGLVGYVPQDVSLFSGTLAENIALGNWYAGHTGLSDDPQVLARLLRAVKLAHLEDLLQRLPEGLQTVVGERGVKLSGGERQRVALARAAFRSPTILLLDEATSSLDNHSERLVQEALFGLSAGRTTIAVAHRLSTVMHAHQIILVDNGRICEQGTHNELMRLEGRYYALYCAGRLLQQEPA